MINLEYTLEELEELDACKTALDWLKSQADPQDAWQNCQRADWMIWFLNETDQMTEELDLEIQLMVLETPLQDGRKVLDLITDPRSLEFIDLKRRKVAGETIGPDIWQVAWAAAKAAWAAAWARSAATARAAAGAAEEAAYDAAYDAAEAAAVAAAVDAAVDAAAAAATARAAAVAAARDAAWDVAYAWQAEQLRKLMSGVI